MPVHIPVSFPGALTKTRSVVIRRDGNADGRSRRHPAVSPPGALGHTPPRRDRSSVRMKRIAEKEIRNPGGWIAARPARDRPPSRLRAVLRRRSACGDPSRHVAPRPRTEIQHHRQGESRREVQQSRHEEKQDNSHGGVRLAAKCRRNSDARRSSAPKVILKAQVGSQCPRRFSALFVQDALVKLDVTEPRLGIGPCLNGSSGVQI